MKIKVGGDEHEVEQCEHKLPPDIKAKWLEALRSGKYKQGTGRLFRPGDTYCCLGVLSAEQGRLTGEYDGPDGSSLVLSEDNPLHFVNDYRACLVGGVPFGLVALNDAEIPFSVIADIIEYAL